MHGQQNVRTCTELLSCYTV